MGAFFMFFCCCSWGSDDKEFQMAFALILYTVLFAQFSALYDAKKILEHKPINHITRFIFRAAVVSLFVWVTSSPVYYLIALGALFSLVFDIALNVHRGISPTYVGKTAKIDRFFRKYFLHKAFLAKTIVQALLCLVIFL